MEKKAIQTCLYLSENLITFCALLDNRNHNQVFGITGNDYFTQLWRNFDLLLRAKCF